MLQSDSRSRGCPGFTLVEVLAALMFLAILVPAIVEGLTLANRVSEVSERKAVAAELAENKLNEQLIGNAWETSSGNSGDFGEAYPGYHWQLTQQNWQGDTTNIMTELAMEVFFPVQADKTPHSIRLTTLVSANGQASATSSPSPASSSSSTVK